MSILPTETLASIRTAVARAVGALEVAGVVDSATGTGMTAAAELSTYVSADRLKGLQLVIKTGTGAVADNDRLITASTTGGVVTVPTWGTNPVAADTFDIYRPNVADKAFLDLAIKFAIEQAQDWHLLDHEDLASLVIGSINLNGGFEDWTAGASAAPDKWTLVGTSAAVARESTIVYVPFRYSAKITNGASQTLSLRQQNNNLSYPFDLLASKSISLSSLVYCATASRVRLRWTNDGSTWNNGALHGGTGWEKLTVTSTALGASPAELTTEINIVTGTQISAYVNDFRTIPSVVSIYDYYLPEKFLRIGQIWSEWGNDFEWDTLIPQRVWDIDRSRERIVFDQRYWTPPGEYRMRLVGQSYQSVPSADSDSVDLPVAYIIAAARSFLVSSGRCSEEIRSQATQIHGEALRLRRQLHRQPMASSVRVR